MKILLPLLLFIAFNANAQTKEETEKWIVETINKYMSVKTVLEKDITHPRLSVIYKYTPIKFSILNGLVNITYQEKPTFMGDNSILTIRNKTVSSNIYSINNLQILNYSSNGAFSGDINRLSIVLNCSCATEEVKSTGEKRSISFIELFLSGYEEPDLLNRLNKAFAQLKTFYPAPKQTF